MTEKKKEWKENVNRNYKTEKKKTKTKTPKQNKTENITDEKILTSFFCLRIIFNGDYDAVDNLSFVVKTTLLK